MKNEGRRFSLALGMLQLFIALGAIPVGLMFVMDPTGSSVGMDTSLLENGPFTTFLVPGLVLLLVNGVGSLVAAIASFRGARLAPELAMGLGLFMVAWIVVQFIIVGFSWLQVLFFVTGMLEFALGWRWRQLDGRAIRTAQPG